MPTFINSTLYIFRQNS